MATTLADFKAAHVAHIVAMQAVIQAEQATGDTAINLIQALGNARMAEQSAAGQRMAVFRQLPAPVQAALAAGTTPL